MKAESSFIAELENKVVEQQRLANTQMIPDWARGVGNWLATNPWRVLVPMSALAYGLLRMTYGSSFRELILGLFGGF
ncbi:MAG: hypothetical protein WAV40_03120 [Microgenomates group bacterium]